jgi:hypothetical protein
LAVTQGCFDYAGLNLYPDQSSPAWLDRLLESTLAHGKPLLVSETGCCTYRGAERAGGMGGAIIDSTKQPLQLDGEYERDERLQARELIETLELPEARGVDGVFVMTFVSPALTHDRDSRFDLDVASYSLVKSYADRPAPRIPRCPGNPSNRFALSPGTSDDLTTHPERTTMPYLDDPSRPALFYRDWGAGQPVLFCSAWALSSVEFQYQMAHLVDRGFRAISFDAAATAIPTIPAEGTTTTRLQPHDRRLRLHRGAQLDHRPDTHHPG